MVNLLSPWGARVPVLQNRGAVTVATGVLTLVGVGSYTVTGEGAVADTVDTINGLPAGGIAVLRPTSGAVTITVSHGTGNLHLLNSLSCLLNQANDTIMLISPDGSAVEELSRSNNPA